jgi:RNA polymerase sigma factor FliA
MVSATDGSSSTKIRQHTSLVRRLALQLLAKLPANVELDDLVQVGFIGLCDALERFDVSRGVQFTTFASQRIKGAMLESLREQDFMSRELRRQHRRIEAATLTVSHQLGRSPSEQEVATFMELTLQEFQNLRFSSHGIGLVYLEDLMHPDSLGDESKNHYLSDEHSDPATILEDEAKRKSLQAAIGTLPKRLLHVMEMYYENDMTFKEIASALRVTESRACQLHDECIVRLRTKLNRWIDDRPISEFLQWYSEDMSDVLTRSWQE